MKNFQLSGRDIQKFLNGFLCVYKPRDVSLSALIRRLRGAICTEANALDEILVPEINVPIVEPHHRTQALVVVGLRKQLDYQ